MRRFLTVLSALAILLAVAVTASAEQTSGTASTLRLESVEGGAEVKNAAGSDVELRDGMRLYSGYKVSTETAGYAYISLDSDKAVKLDASSSGEVMKSGSKLELKVISGKLFFNVTAPTPAGESFSIRTSTMVTGVRGTCGWVEVPDPYTTRISLLEGELTIVSIDPLTGEERSVTITGGQTVTVVFQGASQDYETGIFLEDAAIQELIGQGVIRGEHIILIGTGLTVEELQEEDVPAFVAVEVAKDPDLQAKISGTTELSVPEIIGDAEARLAAEEKAAEEAEAELQQALDEMEAEDVDPLFEEEGSAAAEDTGLIVASGSGGAATTPAIDYTALLTVTTQQELEDALADQYTNISVDAAAAGITLDGLTIGAGETVTLNADASVGAGTTTTVDGTLSVAAGAELTNDGTIDGAGTLSVETGAQLTNNGTVSVSSTNSLRVYGALTNNGLINVGTVDGAGLMTVYSGGTVENYSEMNIGAGGAGTLDIQSGGAFYNGDESGLYDSAVFVTYGGSVTVGGELWNYGSVAVGSDDTGGAGTLTVSSGGVLENAGGLYLAEDSGLDNNGTWTNSGSFGLPADGSATVTNNGELVTDYDADGNAPDFDPAGIVMGSGGTYTDNTAEDGLYAMITAAAPGTHVLRNSDGGETATYDSAHAGEIIGYGLLADLTAYDGTGGWFDSSVYTLYGSDDTELTPAGMYAGGGITLELNGCTLNASLYCSVGSLSIRDSAGGGKISSAAGTYTVGMADGSLTLESGTIESVTVDNTGGFAVMVYGSSTVSIEGGEVSGAFAGIGDDSGATNGAQIMISGGSVSGGTCGIYLYEGADTSVSISGGSVSGDTYGIHHIYNTADGCTLTVDIAGTAYDIDNMPAAGTTDIGGVLTGGTEAVRIEEVL